MKFKILGAIVLFLVCILLWKSNSLLSTSNQNQRNEPASKDGNSFVKTNDEYVANKNKKDRGVVIPKKQNKVINKLNALAEESPELMHRLNLGSALLDADLDPNQSTWDMLGFDKEDSEIVSSNVKKTLKSLGKYEAQTFKIIEKTNILTKIYIPKLEPSLASKYISEIKASFSDFFGEELSEQVTKSFIERSPNTAGLLGRDRVISITLTSDDMLSETKRGYQVRFQVINENNLTFPDNIKDLDKNTSYDGTTIFEQTPDYLSDFIGKTN